jgi:hypothetical protein
MTDGWKQTSDVNINLQPKKKSDTEMCKYSGDNEIITQLKAKQDTKPNTWNRIGRDISSSLTRTCTAKTRKYSGD